MIKEEKEKRDFFFFGSFVLQAWIGMAFWAPWYFLFFFFLSGTTHNYHHPPSPLKKAHRGNAFTRLAAVGIGLDTTLGSELSRPTGF